MMKFNKKKVFIPILLSLSFLGGCNNGSDSQEVLSTNSNSDYNGGVFYKSESSWPFISDSKGIQLSDNLLMRNYVIVFDDSGSMSGSSMEQGKKALNSFIDTIPDGINFSIITLNDSVNQGFTTNKSKLRGAILNIKADGGTPLKSAIKNAYDIATKQAKSQLGYGQYGIIVVTDGDASMGQDPKRLVQDIVRTSPIEIHTIGFNLDENHSLNQKGITNYVTANDVSGLVNAMKAVLAESNSFDTNTFE